MNEDPSNVRLPTRHHQHHANRLHETKKSGSDETKQSASKKKRLFCYRCGGKGHPARLCPSADDCQDVDEVGTEPSSDADSDLFGLDWGDDPTATINSVTERNDKTRGGKELLAFVEEYRLEPTSKSQSGIGNKGANGSHIKHCGKRRFRVKTSAGNNMNTHLGGRGCAQAVDLCQLSHWMGSRGSSARMETQYRLRGPAVCSPYGCGFRRVFTGRAEHEPHQEKRACKTTH